MTGLQQHEIFDLVNDSVMIRTMEGRINFWNRRAEELYGWKKEEAVGKVSHSLLQTQFPKPLVEIDSELARNGLWEGKLVHTTRDGNRMMVESRWALSPEEQSRAVVEINTPFAGPAAPTDPYSPQIGRQEPVPTSKLMKAMESEHIGAHSLYSRLKGRVTGEALLLPERDGPVVCIVSPKRDAYSETFIRAHIERLPAKTKHLYGGWFPTHVEHGSRLLKLHQRAIVRAANELWGLSPQYLQNRALKRFLRTNRVDAVLAEYGPTGASVMDACSAAEVPLIVHFHGFDAYDRVTLEEYSSSYQRMSASAKAIIAVSRDMEQQLLTLGITREKLFYNPYGVDTKLFSGAEPAEAPPVFVAVGRFIDKKAPHLTLLAFKKVVEKFPDAKLKMVGEGDLWESCKQLAKAVDISHAVDFLGARPHVEVASTMRQARAFVQHSIRATYGDSEGTPVGVLEAGAAGLPVVATRHAGIKEALIDDETGLLVEEGDVEGMAAHMMRLAQDPHLASRMGKAGRQRIIEEFSMENSINRLWGIIANCAGLAGSGNGRTDG
jgi:colanic acid/amylovoran biosynthesis glycosyltransferase